MSEQHRHDAWLRYNQHEKDHPRPCERSGCEGVGHVQIGWAPDTGYHWLKCCCCGHKWNPGPVVHAPGVGERMRMMGVW